MAKLIIVHVRVKNPMQGIIKTKTEKMFGFIKVEGQEKDTFFHADALLDVTFDELKVGDTVEFDQQADAKGPRAVNVRRIMAAA